MLWFKNESKEKEKKDVVAFLIKEVIQELEARTIEKEKRNKKEIEKTHEMIELAMINSIQTKVTKSALCKR